MQWLSLVTEDAGVQRLKAQNRQPAVTGDVDAVRPYPRTHAVQIGEGHQPEPPPVRERRSGDRRRGADRRRKQVPVILDTRVSNRRAIGNRRQSEPESAAITTPVRFSVYA